MNTEIKEPQKTNANPNLLHSFKDTSGSSFFTIPVILILLIALFGGIVSGYFLTSKKSGGVATSGGIFSSDKGKIVGVDDTKTFSDTAEGVLKEGGIDGEGAYHLERGNNASQYVYMTSSIVDLSAFINKKVKVWGKTEKAQKAGWLMDVGRVQVL